MADPEIAVPEAELAPETVADDAVAPEEGVAPEAEDQDKAAKPEPDEGEEPEGDDDDDEGLNVEIDGKAVEDEPAEPATPLVRTLRREVRNAQREARRLRRELEEARQPQVADADSDPGPMPTLADVGYDEAGFATAMTAWTQKKIDNDRKIAQRREEQERTDAEFRAKVASYDAAKRQMGAKDFDEAEEAVLATFSKVQQGILVQATEHPERVVYALGKSPKLRAEIAAIKDPIKQAAALARLETRIAIGAKKPSTMPETKVRGASGGASTAGDARLDAALAKSERTNDISDLYRVIRERRDSQRG